MQSYLEYLNIYNNSPTSGNVSTISQFGTDLKNMATFCVAFSIAQKKLTN